MERSGHYYLRIRCTGKEKLIQLRNPDNKPVATISQALKAAAFVQMMLDSGSTAELEALVKAVKFRQHVNIPVESMWQRFSSIIDGLSEGTLHVYEGIVRRFTSWLKKKFPLVRYTYEVTPDIINDYIEHMQTEDGCKPITAKHHIVVLRFVFKTLGTPIEIPATTLKKLNGGTPFIRPIISKSQMEELKQRLDDAIDAATKRNNGSSVKDKLIGYRMLFLLCMYTGMRVSDAHRLPWRDVDFKSNTIWIRQIKTRRYDPEGNGITIPIHKELRQALLRQQSCQVPLSEFVIGDMLANKSPRLLDHNANRTLARILKDSPTHITMHSFRHTFISDGVNRGIPSEVMGALAGHKSIKMTSHYTHIFEESKREAISKLFAEIPGSADNSKCVEESSQLELAKKLASLPPGVVDLLLKSVGG